MATTGDTAPITIRQLRSRIPGRWGALQSTPVSQAARTAQKSIPSSKCPPSGKVSTAVSTPSARSESICASIGSSGMPGSRPPSLAGPERIGGADLFGINPPDREIVAGVFPGVCVVAAKDFRLDNPSELDGRFLQMAPASRIYLHAMHSVVDWFAFAVWMDGQLVRSVSLAPDFGIVEDIGDRLPFEVPYWTGAHPAVEDDEEYVFPFHPLDLAEAALDELFGFALEGSPRDPFVEPGEIVLLRYKRTRPWWKIW